MEASDWSHSNAADRFSVHEEAIYQPAWGQSLSLLTFEEDLPPSRASVARHEDGDELLPELTGELSWKNIDRIRNEVIVARAALETEARREGLP